MTKVNSARCDGRIAIDVLATPLAENHVGIEPARSAGLEVPNPGHGLAANTIPVGIVANRERDVGTPFEDHDPSGSVSVCQ